LSRVSPVQYSPRGQSRGGELIPVLGSQPAGDRIHKPAVGCHYFPPGPRLPPQPPSITAHWPVPNYTACWQRRARVCVNNLPRVAIFPVSRY